MPASKNNFLDHVKWFRKAFTTFGAQAIVSMDTWQAFVRQGEKHLTLFPQFQATIQGQLQYQHQLTDDAFMFAGWLPYRLKKWETALDKLAFKRYCESVGLAVPRYWLGIDQKPANVIVKAPKSSFSQQISGPFRSASEHPLDFALGEYYEEFIEGLLLKVWFWNGQAVCAEADSMPCVWGNGVSTLRELITRRANQYRVLSDAERLRVLNRSADVLRYYGHDLDHVPAKGARHIVEFRYGSVLMHPAERKVLDLIHQPAPKWLAQAQEAGQKLYAAIPVDIREDTVFTVDAVLPADGTIRYLEVNSNPTVHPLVYPLMASKLLGVKTSVDADAVAH